MFVVPFQPIVDALPMKSFAFRAVLAVESFCLVAMVVVLMVLAAQLIYSCMKNFTLISMVVCGGVAVCALLSFFTLEWEPGLIGTGLVVSLHLMGAGRQLNPMRSV